MSLKERLKKAVASQAEIEADEERADAHRSVGCTPVDQLADRSRASVSGVIRSVTLRPREGVPALEAELYDGSGSLDLVWLGRREIGGVTPGPPAEDRGPRVPDRRSADRVQPALRAAAASR